MLFQLQTFYSRSEVAEMGGGGGDCFLQQYGMVSCPKGSEMSSGERQFRHHFL